VISAWLSNATGTGIRISSTHRLTGFKLNRLGPDGRYVDAETHEHIFTSPIPGGFGAAPPPQLATVLTLRTAVERGPAARGRMYLPPVDGYINPDATTGLATVLNAQRVATAGAALVDSINDTYNGTWPIFSAMHVVVASNTGAGTFRRVTRTSAGRVPDVMRSRRSALNEAPEFADVPA
jgi:hypothetical protein